MSTIFYLTSDHGGQQIVFSANININQKTSFEHFDRLNDFLNMIISSRGGRM